MSEHDLATAPASETTDSRERAKNAAAERLPECEEMRRCRQRRVAKENNTFPQQLRRMNELDRRQSNVAAEQMPKPAREGVAMQPPSSAPAAAPVKVDSSVSDLLREAGLNAAPAQSKLPTDAEQIEYWFARCTHAEQRIAELERAYAEKYEMFTARIAELERELDKSQRNVDRMLLKFSQIAPGEHVWKLPNETIKWPYCMQCGIIQREDDKNSPCKGPARIALRGVDER